MLRHCAHKSRRTLGQCWSVGSHWRVHQGRRHQSDATATQQPIDTPGIEHKNTKKKKKKKLVLLDFLPIVYKSFYASSYIDMSMPFSKVYGDTEPPWTTYSSSPGRSVGWLVCIFIFIAYSWWRRTSCATRLASAVVVGTPFVHL